MQRGAELLVPCGSTASVAAKRRTSTIPIVFISVGDPVAMGLIDSLPRPGQNATGFADILADLSGKLVDIALGRGTSRWGSRRLSLAQRLAGLAVLYARDRSKPRDGWASKFQARDINDLAAIEGSDRRR